MTNYMFFFKKCLYFVFSQSGRLHWETVVVWDKYVLISGAAVCQESVAVRVSTMSRQGCVVSDGLCTATILVEIMYHYKY